MRLASNALLLSLLVAPSAARSVEAVLGVETQTGYNSNVFSSSEDPQQDGELRAGPTLYLRDRTGQLTWNLNLMPAYEVYYTLTGINTLFTNVDADLSWQPSAATEFFASEYFSLSPVRSANQDLFQPGTVTFSNNEDVILNTFSAGARHSFGLRWLGEFSAEQSLVQYQSSEFTNSSALSTQASLLYALDPTDRVGGGVGWTQQSFDQTSGGSSKTQYYQIFGVWGHEFSPTMSMRLNAGPTLVSSPDNLQDSFPDTPINSRQFTINGDLVGFPTDPSTCEILDGVVNVSSCGVYQLPRPPRSPGQAVLTAADVGLDGTDTLSITGGQPSASGTNITYFANLVLEKRWRWFSAEAAYVRSASSTSGFAQSVITDTLTLSGAWTPSALWRLQVTGLFTQYESSGTTPQYTVVGREKPGIVPCTIVNASTPCSAFGGPDQLPGVEATGVRAFVQSEASSTLTNYGVSAQLTRFVGRSSNVFGRIAFQKQNTTSKFDDQLFNNSTSQSVEFDKFTFIVGFRYEFEPWHF